MSTKSTRPERTDKELENKKASVYLMSKKKHEENETIKKINKTKVNESTLVGRQASVVAEGLT